MMQVVWEAIVYAVAYGVFYPALYYPITTTVVVVTACGLTIWKAE